MTVFERVAGARVASWLWVAMWMCAVLATTADADADDGAADAEPRRAVEARESDAVFAVDRDLLRWVAEARLADIAVQPSGPIDLDLLAPCAFTPRRAAGRVLSRQWFEGRSSSMTRDLVLLAYETIDRLKPSFGRGPDIDVNGGLGPRRPRARMPLVTVELPFDLDAVGW